MIKQYTLRYHHICGYVISLYHDGVCKDSLVVALDKNLDAACKSVEDAGYTQAYDVQAYKKRLEDAARAYGNAEAEYKKACASPLMFSDPTAHTYKISECEIPEHVVITKYYNGVARSVNAMPKLELDNAIAEMERKGYTRIHP